MVWFLRLLCTADAVVSHRSQSSGTAEVTRRRYCSTHWFLRSDSPSVCGWKAVERFWLIPSLVASALAKCEVKRGSLSLMILLGMPNHRTTLSKYSWATPAPVIVVLQGRKIAAREHPWSTMVRMALWLRLSGSPVIRSIAMLWNGRVPAWLGIRYVGILCRCVRILFCWQVAHPLT